MEFGEKGWWADKIKHLRKLRSSTVKRTHLGKSQVADNSDNIFQLILSEDWLLIYQVFAGNRLTASLVKIYSIGQTMKTPGKVNGTSDLLFHYNLLCISD